MRVRGQTLWRALIYVSGILILALGLTLNTKTGLGVSPILSLSYAASRIWPVTLGTATFLLYSLFVAGEFLLRGRRSRWYDLLQLPFSLVFGRVLDFLGAMIPYQARAYGLWADLLLLLAAILLTGIGVSMTINMHLIPNPGDGIVQAVAEKIGRDQGFAKNIFDLGCVALTTLLCLVLTGRIVGIGLGTLAAMIGVGRAIALTNRLFQEKMCRAAGLMEKESICEV